MHIVKAWETALKNSEALAKKLMEKGMDLVSEGKVEEGQEFILLAKETREILAPFTDADLIELEGSNKD